MLESERNKYNKYKALIIILVMIVSCYSILKNNQLKAQIESPNFVLLGPYHRTNYKLDDTYNQLIDIKNFSFKLNPQPCQSYEAGLLLIIIISSNPIHFELRSTIRKTWGKSTDTTKIVFLLGEPETLSDSKQIQNETLTYGDIVQGNFKDDYRNMTYKHVMGLKWVAHHCPTAKYVLKTDDDVFVNSYALRHFLAREMSPWGARGLIGCDVQIGVKLQRKNYKWAVSESEYADSYYPPFCTGFAILYSQDIVVKLLRQAQMTPYYWIDDVHVTGILAEKIGVVHTPISSLILSRTMMLVWMARGPTFAGHFLFGPPQLDVSKISLLWKAVPM